MPSGTSLFLYVRERCLHRLRCHQVDDFKPRGARLAHRICRTALFPLQIADAVPRGSHQRVVAAVHAVCRVRVRHIGHGIRFTPDLLVTLPVGGFPAPALVAARQDQVQRDRQGFPHFQNRLRSQRVEAQRAAGIKIRNALRRQRADLRPQRGIKRHPVRLRNDPVSRKTARLPPHGSLSPFAFYKFIVPPFLPSVKRHMDFAGGLW